MKLKSCPLCGGEASICKTSENDGQCHYDIWRIHCNDCWLTLTRDAVGWLGGKAYTKEEAIADWNRRIYKEE